MKQTQGQGTRTKTNLTLGKFDGGMIWQTPLSFLTFQNDCKFPNSKRIPTF